MIVSLDVGTMMPNESLLQVLHFVDYKTLVLVKLAGAPFLRVAAKFAEVLALRRSFRVNVFTSWIMYAYGTFDTRSTIRYEQCPR